jgi:hypothetical protein
LTNFVQYLPVYSAGISGISENRIFRCLPVFCPKREKKNPWNVIKHHFIHKRCACNYFIDTGKNYPLYTCALSSLSLFNYSICGMSSLHLYVLHSNSFCSAFHTLFARLLHVLSGTGVSVCFHILYGYIVCQIVLN